MAPALLLLLTLLGTTAGMLMPRIPCGVPPHAWCQNWETAASCRVLEHCPHLTQGPLNMDACAVCQQIMVFLHRLSNDSAVQTVLDAVVEGVCMPLPGPVQFLCKKVAQKLVHELVWQIQHHNPKAVCSWLKLCPKQRWSPLPGPFGAPGTPEQNSGGAGLSPEALQSLCSTCHSLVTQDEAGAAQGSVAEAVSKLCHKLQPEQAGQCQCLAKSWAALELEGLLDKTDLGLLCRLLLGCRAPERQDSEDDEGTLPLPWVREALVLQLAGCVGTEDPEDGGDSALSSPLGPCALGPSFWCSSREAAQRCQALQHCQEHVWL